MSSRVIRTYEVVEELRYIMQVGQLIEGDRLPAERTLCKQFKITRPTLRAALKQLQKEGYLTIKRGKCGGSFVTDLSKPKAKWIKHMSRNIEEFEDILDFRIAVEVMAARLAAIRRTKEDLVNIESALQAYKVTFPQAVRFATRHRLSIKEIYIPGDTKPSKLERTGAEFHEAVARASHNRRLQEAIRKARAEIFRGGKELIHDGLLITTMNDHKVIARAIEKGDPEAAAELMKTHLERGKKRLHKAFTDMDRVKQEN